MNEKSYKLIIAIVIILTIVILIQGIYLFNFKKQIDDLQGLSSRPTFPFLSKKSIVPRFAQKSFNSEWYWDDFFRDEWDPFEEMRQIQKRLNKMFNDSFGRGFRSYGAGPFSQKSFFEPDVDIKEDDNYYIITMDIPGMDKDKISVEIKDKVLKVSGERQTLLEENKGGKFFRKERSYGHFSRAIPLPNNIKEDQISAQYNNGVLSIKIAKETQKQIQPSEPRKIQVL